jgi:hypothetical protein
LTKNHERDKITQNALREVRNMKNPFQYGGVVSGDAFCNRKQEVEDLFRAMENGEKLFVYSKKAWGQVLNYKILDLIVSSIKKLAGLLTEVLHFFRPIIVQDNYREYFVEIEFPWL